jgi:hypothetical protein
MEAMPLWAYAVACVALPSVWALAVYAALGWIERRRAPTTHARDDVPPADYMI